MSKGDHQATASWGNSKEAQAYRAQQAALIQKGEFKAAQQMDIDDLRANFGSQYDEGIQQLEKYTQSIEEDIDRALNQNPCSKAGGCN
ncbi:MAG: hypothetical protein WAU49_20375 [Steroidobacteraceae bacterium]